MRKIFSYKVTLMYLFIAVLFAVPCLVVGKPHGFFMNAIYILCFSLSGCFLVLAFTFTNYISFYFKAGNVRIVNMPLLSTNKTEKKYGSLIDYNNSVFVNEVENVEIVTLSNAQKRCHIGHRHLFSRYLKIQLKNSASHKYIYISIYSKSQVKRIIKMLTTPNML